MKKIIIATSILTVLLIYLFIIKSNLIPQHYTLKTYEDFIKMEKIQLNKTCKKIESRAEKCSPMESVTSEIYMCHDAQCQKGITKGCIKAYDIIKSCTYNKTLDYHTWDLINTSHSKLKNHYLKIIQQKRSAKINLSTCRELRNEKIINFYKSVKCALIFDFNFK